ncbi:hypothetical protein AgCh_005027 [Apium graveolens]
MKSRTTRNSVYDITPLTSVRNVTDVKSNFNIGHFKIDVKGINGGSAKKGDGNEGKVKVSKLEKKRISDGESSEKKEKKRVKGSSEEVFDEMLKRKSATMSNIIIMRGEEEVVFGRGGACCCVFFLLLPLLAIAFLDSLSYGCFPRNMESNFNEFVESYDGMIVGKPSRDTDLDVNPVRNKELSNMRSTNKDETVRLSPPRLVNNAFRSGMIFAVIDKRMGSYPSECVKRFLSLALKCCQENTDSRPSMAEVVRELKFRTSFTSSIYDAPLVN